jgi:hypothetical protein
VAWDHWSAGAERAAWAKAPTALDREAAVEKVPCARIPCRCSMSGITAGGSSEYDAPPAATLLPLSGRSATRARVTTPRLVLAVLVILLVSFLVTGFS